MFLIGKTFATSVQKLDFLTSIVMQILVLLSTFRHQIRVIKLRFLQKLMEILKLEVQTRPCTAGFCFKKVKIKYICQHPTPTPPQPKGFFYLISGHFLIFVCNAFTVQQRSQNMDWQCDKSSQRICNFIQLNIFN